MSINLRALWSFEKKRGAGHTRRINSNMQYSKTYRLFPKLYRAANLIAILGAAFCFTGWATVAKAQDTEDTVRTDISLVQLNVGVVDRQGRAVTSLSKNDFVVYEDNIKQSIQSFEPTNSPFSLVLLLDMSGSTINFRQQLKQAAIRFLDALDPEDRVAVIQFNAKIKMLAGFSTDRKKAAYAIDITEGVGETHFYEALRYSLAELAKQGKGRKAIVVLTD